MKIARIAAATGLVVATLGMAGAATAQDYRGDRGHGQDRRYDDRGYDQRDGRGYDRHDDRGYDRRYDRGHHYGRDRHHQRCRIEWRHHRQVRVCR